MRTLIEYVSVTILIGLLSEDDISYQYRIPISKIPTHSIPSSLAHSDRSVYLP